MRILHYDCFSGISGDMNLAAMIALDVDAVWASPVELGGGFVQCAHGMMPVPAPATLGDRHGAVDPAGYAMGSLNRPKA